MIEARKNRLFERLFLAYTRRVMRNHFNSVHVAGMENLKKIDRSVPVILYCNHSSWWDAILPFILTHQLFRLDGYAMMEEKQLRRYKFFRRVGVFSVERENPRSAAESMRYAASLLTKPNVGLWMYPQGVMLPNDVRPLKFYQGIARIAAMAGRVQFIPIALRFELLMEQRPEAFTLVGEPWIPDNPRTPGQLTEELQQRLTGLLDTLRCNIMKNDLQGFTRILAGRTSVNVRYDRFRLLRGGA